MAVKGKARLQWGRDGAKRTHPTSSRSQASVGKPFGTAGLSEPCQEGRGSRGRRVLAASNTKPFPAHASCLRHVSSPRTAQLSKNRAGGSILWATGTSTAGVCRITVPCCLLWCEGPPVPSRPRGHAQLHLHQAGQLLPFQLPQHAARFQPLPRPLPRALTASVQLSACQASR